MERDRGETKSFGVLFTRQREAPNLNESDD